MSATISSESAHFGKPQQRMAVTLWPVPALHPVPTKPSAQASTTTVRPHRLAVSAPAVVVAGEVEAAGSGRPTLVTVGRRAAATLPLVVVLPHALSSFLMTYRHVLYGFALDNHGYVTTGDARELGVPPGELSKLAARSGLTNVGYGLYRFDEAPGSPHDQYHEAVLRVGEGAHLTRDAVLALHDLALVNPRRIRVGLPRRTEAQLPAWIEVVREDIPTEDLTSYDRIPSTTVARALIDCQGMVMRDRLLEALDDAVRRGLVRRRDRGRVESAIKDNA